MWMLWCGRSKVALDAEIHHEGRAGEFLARDLAIGPAAAQAVGHETLHGAGEVGVHHDRVRSFHAGCGAHADGAAALEEDFLDRLVGPDLDAESLGDARHRRRDRGATADRMKDAVFVFEEGENREQARAAERRHAEVFRLEGKRQANAVIAKEASEIGVHRLMRTEHRQHLEQAHVDEVLPAEERRLEARLHPRELGAVFVEKTAEARRVVRRDRGDLLLHARDVGRRIESRRPRRR